MNYNETHAREAAQLLSLKGRRVLVVGCNTGEDCRYFVDFGAIVVGLDVLPQVGEDFRHERVTYCQASAERIPLSSNQFDLVYSVATMEHVHDIARAFGEMARVTANGGYLYCVSSPLWNSRFGHHKFDLFSFVPWAHLRCTAQELIDQCRSAGLDSADGHDIAAHVEYIFDERFFNRRPARAYIEAASKLPGMAAIQNDLALDDPSVIPAEILPVLQSKGYGPEELLAVTHTYVACKGALGLYRVIKKRVRRVFSGSYLKSKLRSLCTPSLRCSMSELRRAVKRLDKSN